MLVILLTVFTLLQRALGWPYPMLNSTCNATQPLAESTPKSAPLPCATVYPTELRILNSRYPDHDMSPLHEANRFFMLLRQAANNSQIASQVQFQGLPSNRTNTTCKLELVLPTEAFSTRYGPNPSFNVYQVEREAGSIATWSTYQGSKVQGESEVPVFGLVNGNPEALNATRKYGRTAVVGQTLCNETLTFQMGMAYDGGAWVNYWDFRNVDPPAWPSQGWRMTAGC